MVNNNITFEDATILFRNFAGEESKYNSKGNRNFCVFVDPEMAPKLMEDGWNIRFLKPRDDDDSPRPYMQVKVSFGNIPPQLVLVSDGTKKILNEEEIGILDYAELERVDLIVRPYNWEVNGKSGVKAYLKTGYFKIVDDPLARMYGDYEFEDGE